MFYDEKCASSSGSTRFITSYIRTNDFWIPGQELV
jgi:hypothetical protein